jgi:hypothetical protein
LRWVCAGVRALASARTVDLVCARVTAAVLVDVYVRVCGPWGRVHVQRPVGLPGWTGRPWACAASGASCGRTPGCLHTCFRCAFVRVWGVCVCFWVPLAAWWVSRVCVLHGVCGVLTAGRRRGTKCACMATPTTPTPIHPPPPSTLNSALCSCTACTETPTWTRACRRCWRARWALPGLPLGCPGPWCPWVPCPPHWPWPRPGGTTLWRRRGPVCWPPPLRWRWWVPRPRRRCGACPRW